MTKNMQRSTCTLITSVLLLALALQTTANAAPKWRAQQWARVFPLENISSYALTIEISGDAADVYFPKVREQRKWMYFDQFPIVLMSQGARVDKEYYSLLASSVARQGFVVVIPNQNNSVFGNAPLYAEMTTIHEVLAQMRTEDLSPDSPLYGIADTSRMALMGHSFGGASTAFAAVNLCVFPFCDQAVGFERPAELRAVVLVSSNAGTFDIDSTGMPMAIVGGSDEVGRTNQTITYENLEAPKAFITVAGANHYGMCDVNVPPGANAKEGEPDQVMPSAISASRYGYWAGQFLRAHVHNDARAARRIYQPLETEGITIISER